eukprot:50622-Chlamydomonas_euryale.AAC.2
MRACMLACVLTGRTGAICTHHGIGPRTGHTSKGHTSKGHTGKRHTSKGQTGKRQTSKSRPVIDGKGNV